ncbi:MAG: hypothetical protein MUC38_10555 [Cyclobacteriaceae bacterium]|jgi:hypothetical protein|nr:hypothetical protein [Cyclobacteriaceae bacterium]
MSRWVLFFVLLLSGATVFAQSGSEREKIQQLEMQREAERQRALRQKLDSAIALVNEGGHEAADEKLRDVLRAIRSVPSELAFYVGKNSHFLERHKQAIDWLNKYIQLKGTSGQFYGEAVALLRQSEVAVLKETETQRQKTAELFSKDYDIDCGPTGKVVCPVCNGSTVVIKKGYFGNKYSTCQFCQQKGFLVCEDYNKLLRGELKPNATH